MGFDLSTYATVEERLALFWAANPDGRIYTELVRMDDHACLFRAEVYRHRDDQHTHRSRGHPRPATEA